MSCLLTATLHIVDVRLTCLINITYLLTYLLVIICILTCITTVCTSCEILFHYVYLELDRLMSDDIHTSYICHNATRVLLLSALEESAHIGSFDLPPLFMSIIVVNKCHTEL